ncbi:putative epsilon tubulin [Trypanosoma grayi]|uniref:putative epsilon tubulin n=1 Tax=Trypanosoma grayi TaxID=71804 RepID=UPI0004F4B273|nr:putative epsilon tubulin [Trypanosoma grayi]KEG15528.1 putative epsilon tubulin [Trypanosoma grayi]
MPREVVSIQVGQCGNQLGLKWWDVMLEEHKANPQYPDARDALFDASSTGRDGKASLKARCVAIDMEEGVLRSMLRGPLQDLFDATFFVSDVSGAGNNWAVGHMEYGDKYIDSISESVRGQVERCDSIQSFLVMHSLSGGTGSGLGTRVLGLLEDEFPHVFRICPVVMPGAVDDVVTAPYNTAFALRELIEHADAVLPLDNDALARMADSALGRKSLSNAAGELVRGVVPKAHGYSVAQPTKTTMPYDSMNALVAQLLSNLTCAMRFPGTLNMDINEITTNLVPYPRLLFLTAAIAPLNVARHSSVAGPRSVDAMLGACLDKDHQFVDVSGGAESALTKEAGTCLATAIVARGPQITVGDLARNVPRIRERQKLVYWNEDGFKMALCGVSPLGHRDSVLMLANHCSIAQKLEKSYQRFMRLYAVRSHVHHYEKFLELTYFDATAEILSTAVDDYNFLNTLQPPTDVPRSMRELVYY